VNSICLSSLLLLSLGLCGCEQLMLSPNHSPTPVKRTLAQEDVETRDEDSFSSRVAITSKEAGQAASKAMNPASWRPDPNSPAERQRRYAIRKKQKQKQQEPNAFMRWMFPEPKPPRTVGEWLSQDRLDG
jgi:hypothetical protein